MVVVKGLEPMAFRVSSGCSNQLSYTTEAPHRGEGGVTRTGIEPVTLWVKTEAATANGQRANKRLLS